MTLNFLGIPNMSAKHIFFVGFYGFLHFDGNLSYTYVKANSVTATDYEENANRKCDKYRYRFYKQNKNIITFFKLLRIVYKIIDSW